ELLVEIRVPHLSPKSDAGYLQLTSVEGSFPLVTAAAVVNRGARSARVAIGGVAAAPVLIDAVEIFDADGAALDNLARRAELAVEDPLVDLHGDARYRRALAGAFARRAVQLAHDGATGGIRA